MHHIGNITDFSPEQASSKKRKTEPVGADESRKDALHRVRLPKAQGSEEEAPSFAACNAENTLLGRHRKSNNKRRRQDAAAWQMHLVRTLSPGAPGAQEALQSKNERVVSISEDDSDARENARKSLDESSRMTNAPGIHTSLHSSRLHPASLPRNYAISPPPSSRSNHEASEDETVTARKRHALKTFTRKNPLKHGKIQSSDSAGNGAPIGNGAVDLKIPAGVLREHMPTSAQMTYSAFDEGEIIEEPDY